MRKLRLVPTVTTIPFMRWRILAMSISATLAVLSLVLMVVPGMNFGIDFKGGILMEVKLASAPDLGQMRNALGGLGLGEVQLQEFGEVTDILIRIERQPGDAEAQDAAVKKVRGALGDGVDYRRIEFVGPKVSAELKEAGTIAVLLAVALMLIYIWFRFEWHFGVGAVIALLHDVVLSLGVLAATQIEFNLATIAALLTIVGYSINDTVVVYDRVRENLRRFKTMPLFDLLDQSINDTLSRTTMTSFTTLLALIALFLFGGEVIRGFIFVMIWGIVVGTYSSIFIASPLLMFLGLERRRASFGEEPAGAG